MRDFFTMIGAIRERAPYRGPTYGVLLELALHAGLDEAGEWVCWPSVERIGRMARVCENSVHNALRKLTADGIVTAEARPGYTNMWILHIPDEWYQAGKPSKTPRRPGPKRGKTYSDRKAKRAKPAPKPTPAPVPIPEPVAELVSIPDPIREPEPEPADLAGYVAAPQLWRRLAASLQAPMSPALYQTFFGGARLFRPDSDQLPLHAPYLLVCRNKSACRMARSDAATAELVRAVAAIRLPITILPVPPVAAAGVPCEVSAHASH